MTQAPKLGAKLIIIPQDGTSNTRNPYDRFNPEERQKKILELCARIYLRMQSEETDTTNVQSGTSVSETPATDASGS